MWTLTHAVLRVRSTRRDVWVSTGGVPFLQAKLTEAPVEACLRFGEECAADVGYCDAATLAADGEARADSRGDAGGSEGWRCSVAEERSVKLSCLPVDVLFGNLKVRHKLVLRMNPLLSGRPCEKVRLQNIELVSALLDQTESLRGCSCCVVQR